MDPEQWTLDHGPWTLRAVAAGSAWCGRRLVVIREKRDHDPMTGDFIDAGVDVSQKRHVLLNPSDSQYRIVWLSRPASMASCITESGRSGSRSGEKQSQQVNKSTMTPDVI